MIQLIICLVKNIKMRCAQAAIGQDRLLRFVMQIEPGELLRLHPLDHMREVITRVDAGAVSIDAHKFHSLRDKAFCCLASHFVRTEDIGAMVTGEKDNQCFGVSKVCQLIRVAICGRELEIRLASDKGISKAVFEGRPLEIKFG